MTFFLQAVHGQPFAELARAEKGLCTKDESEDFCAKSQTALRTYINK